MSLSATQIGIVLGIVAVIAVGGGAAVLMTGGGDSTTEYTITFDATTNGGTTVGASTIKIKEGNSLVFDQTATKDCFQFIGWYTEANGGTQVTSNTIKITADTTYYARFTEIFHTVTFDATTNGGIISGSVTQIIGESATLQFTQTATREGFDFDGWYTEATRGTKITSGTVSNIRADVTYYAQFVEKTHTVTFDATANGGTVVGQGTMGVNEFSKLEFSQTASKEGYDFLGWYTAASGGMKVNSGDLENITEDLTLYANFQIKTFAVTAPLSSLGYAVTASDDTVDYGSEYVFTVAAPSGKYSGNITAMADGTHGEISISQSESVVTIAIPDIRSDITKITLGGVKEMATDSYISFTISGSYGTSSIISTLDGTYDIVYEALNEETGYFYGRIICDYLKDGAVQQTVDQDYTYSGLTFFGATPLFGLSGCEEIGTTTLMTMDGAKTLTLYRFVDGNETRTYSVDTSTGIMYRIETVISGSYISMTEIWDLTDYSMDLVDAYQDFSRVGKTATLSIDGDIDGEGFFGTMTFDLIAVSPTKDCNRTTVILKRSSDSATISSNVDYEFEERDDDVGIDIPLGATCVGTTTLETIHGEKEVTIWSFNQGGYDYTAYVGDYEGISIPYKMDLYRAEANMTFNCTLTEYIG